MTAERRLAKVEASLSPTALVLRWLAEAHAFDDLEAYVASELDAPPGEFPLDRLARQAAEAAQAGARGLPHHERIAAVDRAVRGTVFRYQLVLRINVRAHETIDRERLLHLILIEHLGHRINRDPCPERLGASLELACHDLIRGRCTELHALETARTSVEARYLDGVSALFLAIRRDWDEVRERMEQLAAMDARLTELDGGEPLAPPDETAEADIAKHVADLVEPARVTALDQLGEGARAQALASRWVRSKLGRVGPA